MGTNLLPWIVLVVLVVLLLRLRGCLPLLVSGIVAGVLLWWFWPSVSHWMMLVLLRSLPLDWPIHVHLSLS